MRVVSVPDVYGVTARHVVVEDVRRATHRPRLQRLDDVLPGADAAEDVPFSGPAALTKMLAYAFCD